MTYMDGAAPLNFSTGGMTPCLPTHLRQARHSGRCDTAASLNAFGNQSGATGSSAYAHSIKGANLTTVASKRADQTQRRYRRPGPSHNHAYNT